MTAFRAMTSADIPAGLALCRINGWNQLARDWELFLQSSADGCRVAINDSGQVIGTATTIRYKLFSWIGMVLVDPAYQRQGIGRQLLREVLDILRDEPTVRLDATPEGRQVYTQLGFNDEYRLSRMHCAAPMSTAHRKARPLKADDFPGILKLDEQVFGSSREAVLKWSFQGAQQYGFVTEDENGLTGFCLGRNGYRFSHIGPIVAGTITEATDLISAALSQCTGPVIVDAIHGSEFAGWLSQNGFSEIRQLIRMQRGKQFDGGDREKQFAILGPEFG